MGQSSAGLVQRWSRSQGPGLRQTEVDKTGRGALLNTRHFIDSSFSGSPCGRLSPVPRGRTRVTMLKVTQPAPGFRCRAALKPTLNHYPKLSEGLVESPGFPEGCLGEV